MKTLIYLFSLGVLLSLPALVTGQCGELSIAVTSTTPSEINNTDATICHGSSITLLLTADGCNLQDLDIEWSTGEMDTASSISITDLTSSETYSATVAEDQESMMASIDITVLSPIGEVPITATPSDEECFGTVITLTAPDNYDMYNWNNSLGGGPVKNVTPPLGFTEYVVTVTDGNGCEGVDSIGITINELPGIELESLDDICIDEESINLDTEANPMPAGGSWSGPGVNNGMFNPASVGVGMHTLTYTVTENGCMDSSTVQIEVIGSPVISFANTPPPPCQNDAPIDLTLALDPSLPGGEWSGPGVDVEDGEFDPGEAGVGMHTLTYTVTENGCFGSQSVDITVNEVPSLAAGFVPSFCTNDNSVNLNDIAAPMPPDGSWIGAGVSEDGTFNPAAAQIGNNDLIYSYTNADGCSNNITVPVVVNSAPQVTASAINTAICQGGPTPQLMASVNSGTGTEPFTYEWMPASGLDNSMSSVTNASNLEPGNYQYSVVVMDDSTCTNIATAPPITVAAQPEVIITGLDATCAGFEVVLTANVTGGLGAAQYIWERRTNSSGSWMQVQTGSSNVFETIPSSSGFYRVRVTFPGSGCNEAVSPEHPILITTAPNPKIISLSGSTEFCPGQITLFKVESPVSDISSVFIWSLQDVLGIDTIQRGSLFSVDWSDLPPEEYQINVVEMLGNNDDCAGEDNLMVNLVEGDNIAPESAEIFLSPINNTLIYNDSSVTCYQWGYFEEKTNTFEPAIPGEIYQSYVVADDYDENRTYFVEVWNGDCSDPACSSTIIFREGSQPGPEPPADASPIVLYPNPNQGVFQLEGNHLPEEKYEMIIFNPIGQPVLERSINTPGGELDETVRVASSSANGIYYLILRGKDGIYQIISFSLMQ